MKTMKGWNESDARTFDEYVNPGDEIDDKMFYYFLDVLPPAEQRHGYFLVGEPVSTTTDGHYTYSKFEERDGKYFYAGLALLGGGKEVMSKPSGVPCPGCLPLDSEDTKLLWDWCQDTYVAITYSMIPPQVAYCTETELYSDSKGEVTSMSCPYCDTLLGVKICNDEGESVHNIKELHDINWEEHHYIRG